MIVGQQVSGGAIPNDSYITAINSGTSITISQLASVTETASTTFANSGVIAAQQQCLHGAGGRRRPTPA